MSSRHQGEYLEFLQFWEARGGAAPRNMRLGTVEGQAYLQVAQSMTLPDIVERLVQAEIARISARSGPG